MIGFSLLNSSGEKGRVSVIAYGTTEIFRDTGQRALERSAGFCGLESFRDSAVE